jgi:hypothetical protein
MKLKVLFILQQEVIKKFIGTKAGDRTIVPGNFTENITGFKLELNSKRLFFFGNFETVNNTSPATWTSTGSPNPSGQVSAPTFTEMTALSNYLQTNFNDWSF